MDWRKMLRELLEWGLRLLGANMSTRSHETTGQKSRKLTREDIQRMIEENRGSSKLDLAERNLECIDLSGLDLRGINLRGARLWRANLQGAMLNEANLEKANIWNANLRKASLWLATLDEANLEDADLEGASLVRASIVGTILRGANLRNALLFGANIQNSLCSRHTFGDSLLQERLKDYVERLSELEKYLKTYPGELRVSGSLEIEQRLKERHGRARDIYRTLKNNFRSIGYYDDASWAYFKERQSEKRTFYPTRARCYYGQELPETADARSARWWWFHLKYTIKWLLDWISELSCGYGEKPLRTVVWAGMIMALFPLLFRWTGGVTSETGAMTWLDYFNYSLGAFTTIGFDQFRATTSLAQTLTSIEALLGISMLALLMFALGNRISRL